MAEGWRDGESMSDDRCDDGTATHRWIEEKLVYWSSERDRWQVSLLIPRQDREKKIGGKTKN